MYKTLCNCIRRFLRTPRPPCLPAGRFVFFCLNHSRILADALESRPLMALRKNTLSETQKRRSLLKRMTIVHGFFLVLLLVIISRLIELQIVRGQVYHEKAQTQHFRGIKLPAKRGEILGISSKTDETNIFATNTTLELAYVDPKLVDDPTLVAETLADILVTEQFHKDCTNGLQSCPRELMQFYAAAFDPIERVKRIQSGALFEPIDATKPPVELLHLPDQTEVRRLFAREIERKISEKKVTFVPLKYGANKEEMRAVAALKIPGVEIIESENLIYANPEDVPQISI